MDHHIRAATDGDNTAVLRILRQIWSAIPQDKPTGSEPSDEYLQRIVKGCEVFVIEQGEEIVGLNALHIIDLTGHENAAYPKVALIMVIGVDEKKRRQGFGTALVDHMWRWLEAEGVETVSLNVAVRNQAAVAFYKWMGFETLSMQMGCTLPLSHSP